LAVTEWVIPPPDSVNVIVDALAGAVAGTVSV
jgi:hypothetical protein